MTVRYWAGARRAAGLESDQFTAETVADLIDQVRRRAGMAEVVAACSVLVDGQVPVPTAPLNDGALVDLLPPFAGG